MKKMIISTLFVFLIALLCSCGASEQPAAQDEQTTSAEEQEPVKEEDTEAEQEEQAEETPAPSTSKFDQYNVISFEATNKGVDEWGFLTYDIKMTNNGDFAVTLVSPVVDFLDADGNILYTTYPQTQSNLKPGASVSEEAIASSEDFDFNLLSEVIIDNYSYYTVGLDKDYYLDINTLAKRADIYDA